MIKKYSLLPLLLYGFCLTLSGCVMSHSSNVKSKGESQVQLRSIQTRSFETSDHTQVIRSVIATLQDLSFVIDKADVKLGVVSATKLSQYTLRITVTVRKDSETKVRVRANAQQNLTAVKDPEFYRKFFTALNKSLFLEK